ncbi:hypothetical protein AAMO2058_001572300 [Amorphochlora amoebiformis]
MAKAKAEAKASICSDLKERDEEITRQLARKRKFEEVIEARAEARKQGHPTKPSEILALYSTPPLKALLQAPDTTQYTPQASKLQKQKHTTNHKSEHPPKQDKDPKKERKKSGVGRAKSEEINMST